MHLNSGIVFTQNMDLRLVNTPVFEFFFDPF
jgi:hypothetical protein